MRKSLVLGTIAALSFAGAASADEGFSYSYLEGSYINSDLLDTDGFQIEGSYGFGPMFFGFASYTDISSGGEDFFDADSQSMEVGLGLHHALSSNLDVVGSLSYLDTESDFDDGEDQFSEDASGFGVGLGLRGRLAPNFELEGGLKYVNLEDSDSDTSVDLNARYFFAPNVSGGVGVNMNDSIETYSVALRWNFR